MKVSSRAVLAIAIMFTVGAWMTSASAHTWSDLATPQAIAGLILGLATTLGAAFGVHTDPQQQIESTKTTTPEGHVVETRKITNTGDVEVPAAVTFPPIGTEPKP